MFALRSGIVNGLYQATGLRFAWDKVKYGLAAIISLRHPKPEFRSPTKVRLDDPAILDAISGKINDAFADHLKADPDMKDRIVRRVLANR